MKTQVTQPRRVHVPGWALFDSVVDEAVAHGATSVPVGPLAVGYPPTSELWRRTAVIGSGEGRSSLLVIKERRGKRELALFELSNLPQPEHLPAFVKTVSETLRLAAVLSVSERGQLRSSSLQVEEKLSALTTVPFAVVVSHDTGHYHYCMSVVRGIFELASYGQLVVP